MPLFAGGFTGHHGRTLHYTRGNMSDYPRRAFIVNFRPQAMIDFERSSNYDFGLAVSIRGICFAVRCIKAQ